MARRGRKRNPEAKRRSTTVKGRSADLAPTPELIRHRREEHGLDHVGTEHPLDALAAKGLLCERLPGEAAGDWLRRNLIVRDVGADLYALHRAVFGSGEPHALDITAPIGAGAGAGADIPETRGDVGRAHRYRTLTSVLRAAGSRVHSVTLNVAVYRRKLPDPVMRPLTYARTLEALRRGLALIAEARPRRQALPHAAE
jgi:hypothetical protein